MEQLSSLAIKKEVRMHFDEPRMNKVKCKECNLDLNYSKEILELHYLSHKIANKGDLLLLLLWKTDVDTVKWKYFKKLANGNIKCKIQDCKYELEIVSASRMRKHILKNHNTVISYIQEYVMRWPVICQNFKLGSLFIYCNSESCSKKFYLFEENLKVLLTIHLSCYTIMEGRYLEEKMMDDTVPYENKDFIYVRRYMKKLSEDMFQCILCVKYFKNVSNINDLLASHMSQCHKKQTDEIKQRYLKMLNSVLMIKNITIDNFKAYCKISDCKYNVKMYEKNSQEKLKKHIIIFHDLIEDWESEIRATMPVRAYSVEDESLLKDEDEHCLLSDFFILLKNERAKCRKCRIVFPVANFLDDIKNHIIDYHSFISSTVKEIATRSCLYLSDYIDIIEFDAICKYCNAKYKMLDMNLQPKLIRHLVIEHMMVVFPFCCRTHNAINQLQHKTCNGLKRFLQIMQEDFERKYSEFKFIEINPLLHFDIKNCNVFVYVYTSLYA